VGELGALADEGRELALRLDERRLGPPHDHGRGAVAEQPLRRGAPDAAAAAGDERALAGEGFGFAHVGSPVAERSPRAAVAALRGRPIGSERQRTPPGGAPARGPAGAGAGGGAGAAPEATGQTLGVRDGGRGRVAERPGGDASPALSRAGKPYRGGLDETPEGLPPREWEPEPAEPVRAQ